MKTFDPPRVQLPAHRDERVAVRARAPLRISFAGGGSDIVAFAEQHGGAVLSMTINRFAYASLWRGEQRLKIDLPNLGISEVVDPRVAASPEVEFARRALGEGATGFGGGLELLSDAPAGSGLGSSSALLVALVAAKLSLFGGRSGLDAGDIASEAYRLEREELGIQGGMQDQYAAAHGGLNFIRFSGRDRVVVEPLRVSDATFRELRYRTLLVSTGRCRSSAGILRRQIAALDAPRSPVQALLREIRDLAFDARRELEAGDIDGFADAVQEGWALKRRVDSAICDDDIARLCDALLAGGARAVKLLGAGGGGYVLAIAHGSARAALECTITRLGTTAEAVDYESDGVRTWTAGREP
jgi:D-glycero-alpha-D-manno-heptose-7-phosphate kinase